MPNRDVCAANAGAEAGFQTSMNDNVALQDKGLISHSGAVRRQAGSSRAVASLDSGVGLRMLVAARDLLAW